MSNPLVSALETLFEAESGPQLDHRPLTVRTLLRLLDSWTPGAHADLPARLQQLLERVQDALRHTQDDLRQDRDEELSGYLRELGLVYADLALCLQSTRRAVVAADSEAVWAEVSELRSLQERLIHWDRAVQEWNGRVVLRCPRCGRCGEDACATCRLELLYNDADARPATPGSLGAEYAAVRQAWSAVLAGEATLATLWAPLDVLERLLRRYHSMAQDELKLGMAGDRVTRILKRIALAARESLAGAGQMRHAATTRRARDLNEGWECIFDFGIEIRDCVPELQRALGRPSAQPTAVGVQDSLLIDFD